MRGTPTLEGEIEIVEVSIWGPAPVGRFSCLRCRLVKHCNALRKLYLIMERFSRTIIRRLNRRPSEPTARAPGFRLEKETNDTVIAGPLHSALPSFWCLCPPTLLRAPIFSSSRDTLLLLLLRSALSPKHPVSLIVNMSLERTATKETGSVVKKETSSPSSGANERIETASITSSVQQRYESTSASQ